MEAKLIDNMGTDLSIVNAARVSFNKESTWEVFQEDDEWTDHSIKVLREKDEKLIKYLAEHKHWSPFSHTAITLYMKAPIPIRTQCFKHKVGFTENEVSRRYVSDIPDYFVPEFRTQADNKKQGSGDALHCSNNVWKDYYKNDVVKLITTYNAMINDGVAEEQARFILPQGVYTEWIWTGSLYAYARFCNLRKDSHAQKEVQELAGMVADIIEPLYPVSWRYLVNG